MGKIKRKLGAAGISMNCHSCNTKVDNVDANVVKITCWRCVAKTLNHNSVFVDELTPEEWAEHIKKHSVSVDL